MVLASCIIVDEMILTITKHRKSGFFAFAGLFLLVFVFAVSPSWAKPNPRYASFVMDADTGAVLSQSHADKVLHPASLTKIMTLLLVFERLESGQLRLKDQVPISRHAASMEPSKLNLPVGSTIRVEDAILALVTKSANDIAVALAEKVAGSEYKFARLMTAKAHEIGMTRTIFRNASGLHDEGQVSTARDMAKLARLIIHDYPQYYRYFSTENFTYRGKSYHNHNRLMGTYPGMDGMKTGYVAASGFNLVASAVRGNRRLIGVVFGGRTARSRNDHMATLLDAAFEKTKDVLVASAYVGVNNDSISSLVSSAPPLPERKPAVAYAIAALNDRIMPAGGRVQEPKTQYKWSSLNSTIQKGMFGKVVGEGDYDIDAPLTGAEPAREVSYTPPAVPTMQQPGADRSWSIQVGAFTSRAATDQVLHKSKQILPQPYASAKPVIAPLRTGEGWLFRARFTGFTREDAIRACGYIRDCLLIAPNG